MTQKTQRVLSKDAIFQKFEVLKTNRNKRYKYGEFFVEGVRNLNCAVENGWEIVSLLYTTDRYMSTWATQMLQTVPTTVNYQLTATLMDALSGKTDSSELMAVVKMRPDNLTAFTPKGTPLYMLFDRPSNKGNLGTIIRSCDSLGVDGLIITGHAVDLYDPDVIAATMGSFFHLPVVRVAEPQSVWDFVADLKQRYPNFTTVGTTAHKEHPLHTVDLKKPTLLLVGNETDGLCRTFQEGCDITATIPMADTAFASSLNVGCAATVLLYEVMRQRNP